jgi:Shedu protein SduA, C-terminal
VSTRGGDQFEDADFWDFDEDPEERAVTGSTPAARAAAISHRRNIATTGELILHDGPRVRVAAKTTLIYDQGKPHSIGLQIARLGKRQGFVPGWDVLPARVHLHGDEVEALFSYLAEARASITELRDTEYLVVKTGGAPNIQGLQALIEQIARDPDAFLPLTSQVGPAQIAALRAVVNLGRFERARNDLKAMVEANRPEAEFQTWFERNDWVFGSEYVGRLEKPRDISPDSQIDLLFLAVDGFADIFELKRPGAPILVRPAGRNFYQPSSDLNAAFSQAVHYLAEARGMGLFNMVRRDLPVYQPRVRLVIGRSTGWDQETAMAYRDLTAAWHQVELLTYDMVLRRLELLVRTLSRDLQAAATDQ